MPSVILEACPFSTKLPQLKNGCRYLESLANIGRYAEAVNAAGVDPSLPHYWRRTDLQFVAAEMAAKNNRQLRKSSREGGFINGSVDASAAQALRRLSPAGVRLPMARGKGPQKGGERNGKAPPAARYAPVASLGRKPCVYVHTCGPRPNRSAGCPPSHSGGAV